MNNQDIAPLESLQVGDWFGWVEEDWNAWHFNGFIHVGMHPKYGELVEVFVYDVDFMPAKFTVPANSIVWKQNSELYKHLKR